MTKKEKGITLLEEVIENLENPKISLFIVIQKLNRIGKLLDEKDLIIWSEIHLGNDTYNTALKDFIEYYSIDEEKNTNKTREDLDVIYKRIKELGIVPGIQISNDELTCKATKSGGGFANIAFIEEKYNDLVKLKRGNDGTYYKSNLASTISIVKAEAYKKASFYHKKYAYENLPESNFEILKDKVEDTLLEIDPELAEMLMLAFKSVSSPQKEEWSQASSSCRRFFEKLADNLYPATDETINGRPLKKENYINRLWAFMDKSIESKSNKDIAKIHVDLIGFYLQNLYKVTNKGVHANLDRYEAVKTVMHIYLMCADLLEYLDKKQFFDEKPNIYTATLDEIEIIGKVSRNTAKEIIKLRVKNEVITEKLLKGIAGVGDKTFKTFIENISIDKK